MNLSSLHNYMLLEAAYRAARLFCEDAKPVTELDLFNRLQFYVIFKWLGQSEAGQALLNKFVKDGDLARGEKDVILNVSKHSKGEKDIDDVKLEEVFEFLTTSTDTVVTKIFKLLTRPIGTSSIYSYLGGFRQSYLPLLKTYKDQIKNDMGAEAAKTQETIKKQIYDKFSLAMNVKLKDLIKDEVHSDI